MRVVGNATAIDQNLEAWNEIQKQKEFHLKQELRRHLSPDVVSDSDDRQSSQVNESAQVTCLFGDGGKGKESEGDVATGVSRDDQVACRLKQLSMRPSSDEESDISESEIKDYVDKPYELLKSQHYKVEVRGTLRCPFCTGKMKRGYKNYKELLQHASAMDRHCCQHIC
ncbi:Factor of DNA methylation 1 [Linum perenne]